MARSLHPPPRRRLVRRSHRSIVGLLVTVAVIGWVLTLPWRGPAPPGSWSGRFPANGLGLVVLLGLTAGRDDGVERLVEEIQRFRDGEDDVDFATDRDDEVGELYAAVDDMAEALEACEREREETRERARERAHDLERYRPLVESAGEPMAVLDAEGRFEVLNEAMANFHGTSREELLGTDARQLVVADGVAAIEDAQRRLLSDPDRQWEQVEVSLTDADGDEHRYEANVGVIRDEEGAFDGSVLTFRDVTERKERERELRERQRRLEKHREYTSDILDAIDDVFYVIDDEGNFLRWNESARAVTGYDDDEIAALNAMEFFDEADHPRIVEAIETVFAEPGSRRVEAPIYTKDGETVPYEFVASTVENPDGEREIVGIGRDITERKRREAALERTTELLEQAQHIAAVGGWEYDAATETLTETDEFRRLHGIEPDEPVTIDDVLECYHEDDLAFIEETFEAAIEQGKDYDMEVRLRTTDGTTRWVRSLAEPIEEDGETSMLRGSVQDITEAKEREEAIRTLHDTAQELLQTETASEVADLVVETAADVLDVSGVSLYLLDADANLLVPEACSASFEELTDGAPPIAIGDEEDPIWNSFATGTRQVVDASDVGGGTGPFTKDVGGGLVVPIGAHGVFVVTTAQSGVEVRTRQLVETLIATTEAAFDRLESEANLQERDAELEAQNRQLRRQIQLTDVLRRVDRSLIGANGHEEIERAVCEQLADSEDIVFAWIGSVDSAGENVVPRTWAGDGDAYLDAVSLSMAESAAEPAVGTAHRGEPTVASNVLAEVSDEAWRKSALDSGFRSALAVPIAFEEYRHGVLAVYADEADAFEELERTVFAELGRTIANAINAVQTREALHADTLLELSLRIEAPDTFLAQVARRADRDVEYVGIGRQSGEETSVFFAVEGAADVGAVLDELVTVTEHRLLSEREGRRVFEATVTGEMLPAKLIRHGAQPKTIRASPADVSVVLSVPTSTDVREFVEMLQESYPTVELEGRRNVTRATRTRQQMVSDLLEGLTERQLEVLRTAYYADYFDWPRGSSGEEIAEMLDVTQPTVSRHLRLGQRQLLSRLLEEEPTTVTAS